MNIFVIGLSFKTAPVGVREQFAVAPSLLHCRACRLKLQGGLSEIVLLSTCNRVEVYGVADRLDRVKALFACLAPGHPDLDSHLYFHKGRAAIRHLFAVAGGLDSMVLGETEITGQVKNAYQKAQAFRLTGKITNRLFQKALQVAKQIRTRTAIGRGATSVGSVAVELAGRIFDTDLSGKTIMIIGAGKMGEACVRHLSKKGAAAVLVSNRSHARGEALAREFGGRAIRFDQCVQAMSQVDIVVSSTGSPGAVLSRQDIERVMQTRRDRALFLIDIAVPRDIDPDAQRVPNVYRYDIDDLDAMVRENVRLRERQLAQCHSILEQQTNELAARLDPPPHPRQAGPDWAFGLAPCAG